MSDNNEAKVVIAADAEMLRKFFTEAMQGFRDFEGQGKKSLKDLDTTWTTFTRGAADATKALAKEISKPFLDPVQQALGRALNDAREWRSESTRIMGETGTDWKTIGGQIDAVSQRTRRMPEDTSRYLDTVRQLTGSWEFAQKSAEDYSDAARVLGRRSLSEMAPLAATMQNIFHVDKVKPFFDQAIAGARALGQSGEMAIRQFERIAPAMVGMVPKGQGPEFAKATQAMIPAMQKMGLSPEESEMAMQQIVSSYSGDNLINLQRQMRGAGILGKGESLKDKYGRLTKTIPEIMALEAQLIKQHARSLGGGPELAEKIAKQSVGGGMMAGLLVDNEQFQQNIREAAAAAPGADMAARKAALEQTPELQRKDADRALALFMRKGVGEAKLTAEDLGVRTAAGAMTPESKAASDWRMGLFSAGKKYGELASLVPGAGQYGAGAAVFSGLAESSLVATEEAKAKGMSVYAVGKGADKGAAIGGGDKPFFDVPALLSRLFSKDAQRDQAAANAEALGSKVLKVQVVTTAPPAALSGGGEQG